jgi:predicted ATPase
VPLQISGEHEYPIPPLTLPDPRRLPSIEHLSRTSAVRLFVERAQAIDPGFALTDGNARAVAEICVRLDGLPLAIELAAARTRLMSPASIASRLHNRLDLLTGGRRDAGARQRTLRATIEWSYNLLDEAEQRLFRRLGVFVGGRTLQAIEAVCDADGRLGLDVVDGVETLLYSSLLRRDETSGGEPRFRMLETIHEFAMDKLAAQGELDDLRLAHARFFLDVAESAGVDAAGNRIEAGGLAGLDVEHANIRVALEFALAGAERGDAEPAEIALRLASAMARFWYLRGHWSEADDWLSAVLAKAGTTPASAWCGVLHGAGQLAVERGDYAAGRAFFERCVAASRLAGDEAGAAFALGKVGDAAYAQGDFTAARNYLQEGLFQTRRLGDPFNTARLMGCLGELLRAQGDFAEACRLDEEALAILAAAGQGSSSGIGVTVCNLGNALLRDGKVDRAAAVLADALSIAERLGSTIDIAIAVFGLAGVAAARGEPLRAARLLGAAEAMIKELGARLWPADRLDFDHHMAVARAQTDQEAFEKARLQGREMGVEDTIRLAVGTQR